MRNPVFAEGGGISYPPQNDSKFSETGLCSCNCKPKSRYRRGDTQRDAIAVSTLILAEPTREEELPPGSEAKQELKRAWEHLPGGCFSQHVHP